jgi:putative lipoprotein
MIDITPATLWKLLYPMTARYLFCLPILMLLLSSGCATIKQAQDPWFGKDKIQHFAVSTVIGAGTAQFAKNKGATNCDAFRAGIGMTIIIGTGKETYDKYIKGTFWNWKDMVWNLAGGFIGSAAVAQCN